MTIAHKSAFDSGFNENNQEFMISGKLRPQSEADLDGLLQEIQRDQRVIVLVHHDGHRVVATHKGEGQGETVLGDVARGLVDDLGFENHHVIDEFVEALYQYKIAPLRTVIEKRRA